MSIDPTRRALLIAAPQVSLLPAQSPTLELCCHHCRHHFAIQRTVWFNG
jgi:hypothetical protein